MPESIKRKLYFVINVVYAAVVICLLYIGLKLLGLMIPFLIALCLVMLFQPVIRKIHTLFKVNQKIISLILMALLYTAAGGLIFWLITQFIIILKELFTHIPAYYQEYFVPAWEELGALVDHLLTGLPEVWAVSLLTIRESLSSGLQQFILTLSQKGVAYITGFINTIPSFFVTIIFTILLSFFISIHYENVTVFFKKQVSTGTLRLLLQLKKLLKNTVWNYIIALLKLMAITFMELSAAFIILGISSPIAVAAGIAVFDALPVFGTGGIMIPWILLTLIQQNIPLAAGLTITYGLVTLVRNIIEPKIIGDQLGINPVVSLMSIYIGFRVLGVLGMITFPILIQILLVLHQNGTITLYRDSPDHEDSV